MAKSKSSKAKERKRQQRKERIRKQQHAKRYAASRAQDEDEGDDGDASLEAERALRAFTALSAGKGRGGPEDEDALAERFMRTRLGELEAEIDDPVERAQQLAYEAIEAATDEETRAKAQASLELDATNFDARFVLALLDHEPGSSEADAAVAALGDEALAALADSGVLEERPGEAFYDVMLRPLLRAIKAGALAALRLDDAERADRMLTALLDADHEDNLDGAGPAAAVALQRGDLERARCAVARLAGTTLGQWLHAFERCLSDDGPGARSVLGYIAEEDEPTLKALEGFFQALETGDSGPVAPPEVREEAGLLMMVVAEQPALAELVREWLAAGE